MALPPHYILHSVARRYGTRAADLTLLGESASCLYEFRRDGHVYILRLTEAAPVQQRRIVGEIDWMDFLAQTGVRVPPVVHSRDNRLVEIVDGSGPDATYLAVVFEKMAGVHPEGAMLTEQVLFQLGRTLGQIHRVGREYRPLHHALDRPHWYELAAFQIETRIPASQPLVAEQCRQTLTRIHALPTPPDGYGLIHASPISRHILLDDGQLTLLDFKASCYGWYALDLAVAILHADAAAGQGPAPAHDAAPPSTKPGREPERTASGFAHRAWPALYAGYISQHPLPARWLELMPLLLRLCVMQAYAEHVDQWHLKQLEEWQEAVLRRERAIIEAHLPVLDLPWHAAAQNQPRPRLLQPRRRRRGWFT